MTNEIVLSPAAELQPASLFTPTPKAAQRVLEFFTAQINNDHTRKAWIGLKPLPIGGTNPPLPCAGTVVATIEQQHSSAGGPDSSPG